MTVEYQEVERLVATFDEALLTDLKEVRQVVSKGALNIKNGARRRASGNRHAPAYPASIGYDLSAGPASVEAEIGPDKLKRQGALGNLLEYGSVNNAPQPHIRPAADEELPRFERALEDLAARRWES